MQRLLAGWLLNLSEASLRWSVWLATGERVTADQLAFKVKQARSTPPAASVPWPLQRGPWKETMQECYSKPSETPSDQRSQEAVSQFEATNPRTVGPISRTRPPSGLQASCLHLHQSVHKTGIRFCRACGQSWDQPNKVEIALQAREARRRRD
jgi:hypothetical protein